MNTSKNKVEIVEDVVFLIINVFFCILGVFSLVLGLKYYSSKWTRISSARKILIIFSSITFGLTLLMCVVNFSILLAIDLEKDKLRKKKLLNHFGRMSIALPVFGVVSVISMLGLLFEKIDK